MSECQLCKEGDFSVNVWCQECGVIFHLHQHQLSQVVGPVVIVADCPGCQVPNYFVRSDGRIVPVKWHRFKDLPVTDHRGT